MADKKSVALDLTQGKTSVQLVRFAMPFMMGIVLQTLYNVVDMVIVGQYVGSEAMSAVSISGQLTMFFTNLCIGFSTGGQIMIAQYTGAGKLENRSRTIGTLFTSIFSISLVLMVVLFIFRGTFLTWLNTPAECWDQAIGYTFVSALGLPFVYGYNCVCAVLRGMGDSKRPFYFIAISAITNLVLDLLFIVGLNLAAVGAALATVMAQALSFVMAAIFLWRHRDAYGFHISRTFFKPNRRELVLLIKLGIPMALKSNAITLSMMFVNSYINAFGVAASAASGAGGKVANLTHIITQSLNMASSAMIGQNIGAGKPDRVREVIKTSIAVNLVLFVFNAALMLLFPRQLFSIFTHDPAVLEYAKVYLQIAIVGDLASALMSPCNALIEGTGHTTLAFFIAILDGVFTRIVLSLVFGITMGMGLIGFWLGNAVARYTTAILAGAYAISGRWAKGNALLKE